MALDVLLHVLVGQTLEDGLVGLGSLAGDSYNLEGGVGLADFLKVDVFLSAKLASLGVVLLGQSDAASLLIHSDVSHGSYLFLSDSLGSLFFISEGVVPFVVITLYDMELMNLSL